MCAPHFKEFQEDNRKKRSRAYTPKEIIDRIYKNVKEVKGCHVYQRCRPSVYGKISMHGIKKRVHVYIYEACIGQIPIDHHIHHTCENPKCVNPEHLEMLSSAEHRIKHNNKRDKATGRFLKK